MNQKSYLVDFLCVAHEQSVSYLYAFKHGKNDNPSDAAYKISQNVITSALSPSHPPPPPPRPRTKIFSISCHSWLYNSIVYGLKNVCGLLVYGMAGVQDTVVRRLICGFLFTGRHTGHITVF